ncbi:MAG: BatA domain-containing protein, partial [Ahrensia sp.]
MLGFGAPLVLLGLLALPAIWWLLRLTPPKPRSEIFPPLRLLARVIKPEETPAQSPWWLTLLRLTLAALVIIALAKPLLNPQGEAVAGNGPILLMVDNGWAQPEQWTQRIDQARLIAEQARDNGRPLALAFTVASDNAPVTLENADSALPTLDAAEAIAATPDRDAALAKLMTALDETPSAQASLIILSDALAHNADTFATTLGDTRFAQVQV